MRATLAIAVAVAALAACGDDGVDTSDYLTRAELMDPEACRDCHPDHVEEWEGSMHAFAADDPVFRAMNARGQRETGGELGDFCVKCHAPMAVREGLTTDGLDLDDVPKAMRGVGCFFCHSAEAVEGEHNNPIALADDGVLRGGFGDAIENGRHATAYSRLLDRNAPESSALCGSCHDIVTPAGVHLERTYAEYKASVFPRIAQGALSCGDCHTPGVEDVVAEFDGVPLRTRHEHTFPGVDTAIGEWPGKERQLADIARDFSALLQPRICHNPAGNKLDVRLTNIGAGHMFPSGASQDRRAWVQLRAFDAEGAQTYASGVVPEGGSPVELGAGEPAMWLLRDRAFDAEGEETHMFWDVATVESELLPPAVTLDANDPAFDHSVLHEYPMGAVAEPDRVELEVFIQAIGRDVLDDLIGSGDLEPSLRESIPTLKVGETFVWTRAAAGDDRCLP